MKGKYYENGEVHKKYFARPTERVRAAIGDRLKGAYKVAAESDPDGRRRAERPIQPRISRHAWIAAAPLAALT